MNLVTYYFTPQEKQDFLNGLNIDLSDKVESIAINDDGLMTDVFGKDIIDTCLYVIVTWCSDEENTGHTNGYYNGGGQCNGYQEQAIGTNGCTNNSGGGTSDSGDPSNPTDTTTSDGYTPHPGGGGATAPTLCETCEEFEECSAGLAIALITNRLTTLSAEQLGYIENSDNCEQTTAIQDYLNANPNNTATEQFALQALEALMNDDVETFEEFIEQDLNNELELNPFLLLDIDCNQIDDWIALAQHTPIQSVIDKIDNIPDPVIGGDFEIQYLENAEGTVVNMDYFPVKITTLPKDPATGIQFTADQFLNYIRLNINNFVNDFYSNFSPSTETGIDEAALWASSNPEGSVIHIDIPGDDGTVVCSGYNITPLITDSDFWIFSTIETQWDFNHPVSGNRQFGYNINSDGSYTFFTRGVDRFTDVVDMEMAYYMGGGNPFFGADNLWESFQEKLNEFVNNVTNSGVSSIVPPSISRPQWNDVKEVLEGTKTKSDLGCN
jgi:hypothetical protein